MIFGVHHFERGPGQQVRRHGLGRGRHDLWACAKQAVAHVAPKSPSVMMPEEAVAVDDAEAAEAPSRSSRGSPRHHRVGQRERQAVALVHQVADEFQPRAELAAGVERLEVARGETLLSSSAMARQSPRASCITVEVVGASPCGQASGACGSASTISAAWPSAIAASAVIAISGTAKRRE